MIFCVDADSDVLLPRRGPGWRGHHDHLDLVINVTMGNEDSYQVVRYMNFSPPERNLWLSISPFNFLGYAGGRLAGWKQLITSITQGYTVLFNKCKTLSTYSWAGRSRAEGPDPTYAYCRRYASALPSHHAVVSVRTCDTWYRRCLFLKRSQSVTIMQHSTSFKFGYYTRVEISSKLPSTYSAQPASISSGGHFWTIYLSRCQAATQAAM